MSKWTSRPFAETTPSNLVNFYFSKIEYNNSVYVCNVGIAGSIRYL